MYLQYASTIAFNWKSSLLILKATRTGFFFFPVGLNSLTCRGNHLLSNRGNPIIWEGHCEPNDSKAGQQLRVRLTLAIPPALCTALWRSCNATGILQRRIKPSRTHFFLWCVSGKLLTWHIFTPSDVVTPPSSSHFPSTFTTPVGTASPALRRTSSDLIALDA